MDLFKPKVKSIDPTPVPTVDDAARSQEMSDAKRKRRGRQSTILVPDAQGARPAATILGG